MNLVNLNISSVKRIIAHTIHPKTATVDAFAKLSNNLLTFSKNETEILFERLQDALSNSKKTFKLDYEDLSDDSLYKNVTSIKTMNEKEFIEYSKILAEDLANAHFRIKIPGGYCLIGEGETINREHFFFIIKAELQEVFSINDSELQLIKDVFLSPAKDFYKIGFFIESDEAYVPFMYDDQFSLQKKDLTEYFYGKFLGLTTDKNDSLKSKNFFYDTKEFIETNISNVKDRLGLVKALTVLYREDATGVLSPKDFSERYFEDDLKFKFDEIINSKYPHSFTKDISLIDRRLDLQRLSIPLSYSMVIIGNADSLSDVEIIDYPTEGTIERLEPEINNGIIRQMVVVRESLEENVS